MCGIFGITGEVAPFATLLKGLAALEYRGYDSAGIALVDTESPKLWRIRSAGQNHSLGELQRLGVNAPRSVGAAIAHTRWATHGAPIEVNAHPIFDCTGQIAIVHNGIIENHRELQEGLVSSGHRMVSATDTEVLAHLIEDEMAKGAKLSEALRRCLSVVRGDFAVGAICASEPDTIVGARRTSPLVFGVTSDLGIISSDIGAALRTTRELYVLEDDEVVEIRPGSFAVSDKDGGATLPHSLEVDWNVEDAQRGGYPDFMSKEIAEQPFAITNTLLGRFDEANATNFEELVFDDVLLRSFERVVLIACGSSYHASLSARQAIEDWAQLPASAEIASEFRYRNAVIAKNTLVIAISQSGETIDTLHTMREAKRRGATTLAVTNVVDSVMAREADGVLYTRAGPEIGVASTKCHVVQIVLLSAFALHLARVRDELSVPKAVQIGEELRRLPAAVASALDRTAQYRALAEQYSDIQDVYFLGRRIGLPIALEGALKLKELAYVRAEAYPAGEMKHGPLSLIEPGAVALVIATRTPLWEKIMANVEEVRARGATILAVIDEGDEETARLVDGVMEVPATSELLSPAVDVIPLQCFAYSIAKRRGNDVDRPRNLAKVVTVE